MTKSLVALFGLVVFCLALTGCSTITESPKERLHNIGQITNLNAMQFNEASDDFWLVDRPSRLSTWIIR